MLPMGRTRRALAGACAALVLLGTAAPAAAGTSRPAPAPTTSRVHSLKAEAKALEQRIVAEAAAEQKAGEQLDQAESRLAVAQGRLAHLRVALRRERRKVRKAQRDVRRAAVEAYVADDAATAQFGAILKSGIADAGTVSTYSDVATARLAAAESALRADERRLAASLATQKTVTAGARGDVAAATRNRQAALQAAAASKATLGSVKGRLAAVIAAQEAAAAAAAEARAKAAAAAEARARAEAEARAKAAAAAARRRASRRAARQRAAKEVAAKQAAAKQAAAQEAAAAAARRHAETQAAQAAAAAEATAQAAPTSVAVQQAAAAATLSASNAAAVGAVPIATSGHSHAGDVAVQTAESYLGVPYVWGGASRAGLDCSGLTMLAWGAAGVSLAHSAWYQYNESAQVSLQSLQPGDLLFYAFANDGPDPVTHVAMYVGSGPYGTLTIIQAPQPGQKVSYAPFYYLGLVGAGRPGTAASGTPSGTSPSGTATSGTTPSGASGSGASGSGTATSGTPGTAGTTSGGAPSGGTTAG